MPRKHWGPAFLCSADHTHFCSSTSDMVFKIRFFFAMICFLPGDQSPNPPFIWSFMKQTFSHRRGVRMVFACWYIQRSLIMINGFMLKILQSLPVMIAEKNIAGPVPGNGFTPRKTNLELVLVARIRGGLGSEASFRTLRYPVCDHHIESIDSFFSDTVLFCLPFVFFHPVDR